MQLNALSQLFDLTECLLLMRRSPKPDGLVPISGNNLKILPMEEPPGKGWVRKVALFYWMPTRLIRLWNFSSTADVIHAAVPGDLGTVGILLALLQHKPLFVRHCGTWGNRATLADKFLAWLLPRIAGGRNVVLATGGGDQPPEPGNPNVHWIFSTSIGEAEMSRMPVAQVWQPGVPLRLITVGRLARGKNVRSIVEALPAIRQVHPDVHLDILGDGEEKAHLEKRIAALGLEAGVSLHGNVDHEKVIAMLSSAHLFLFPTRVKEGFPKALLEAMAVGLPVIASDVSVIPHLIKDCGQVLDRTTPDAIAAAVLELAAQPARWISMSGSARRTASGYTLENWRDQIGAHLEAAWGLLKGAD